ncbi:MAG: gliding motility-associated C-terminal domain-containing protein [Chitinophagaceae bacterium]|nr:MAG: gliding motility-associated C-terminal domain-containing protein [Chitinophagaceae bacterium]
MRYTKTFFETKKRQSGYPLLAAVGSFLFCLFSTTIIAQDCPKNIDFERGTFENWTCYIGNTTALNNQNQINLTPSSPIPDRHTMYSSNTPEMDPYGGFPVKCPNGSGYSIRLGNSTGGGEAEGISYEFTIPSNKDEYSLIYHYAVVFQDPIHTEFQQPRMVVEITNVTDDVTISCSSFTFIPFGTILPGFYESSLSGSDGTPVWCKNWSAVSINLDHLAGKTYQSYKWFDTSFTQVLGTEQSVRFFPLPAAGTIIAVEIIPYDGYGCIDTLYAKLLDNLTVTPFAGPDTLYCGVTPVGLGANPKPGLVYSWSPVTGLSNPAAANPFANPAVTTTYCLSVRNNGGGCLRTDTVVVSSASIDNSLDVLGKTVFCLGTKDSAVFLVKPADSIQWYKDGLRIPGANQPRYQVSQSGTYQAELFSYVGCHLATEKQTVFIDKPRPGIQYPIEYAVSGVPYPLQARDFGASVLWNPATYLNSATNVRPLFQSTAKEQSYNIRIETETGCVTIDTLLVKTVPAADIMVPTAFTPNSDGRNDRLYPVLMGIKELRYFRVFNRWGQLLFETKNTYNGWDGRINGNQQATGVVVWVAEGVGSDNRVYQRRGTCVLIR